MRCAQTLAISAMLLLPAAGSAQDVPLTVALPVGPAGGDAAWPSPDGRRLVFIQVVDRLEQLFIMDANGSNPVQLTHDAANHEDPSWSPDGRDIAYVSDADSAEVIIVMRSDGSDPRRVSPANLRAIHPTWSADSKRILFCTDDDLHPPKKNISDIYSVDVATGQASVLVTGGINTYPNLSRDGRRLVFRRMVGDSSRNSEVFVANGDGSEAVNLTRSEAFDGWPEWSPDGRWIAFASNRNRDYNIYLMRADGGDVRLVSRTTGRATAPHWAPDGQSIYFTNCNRANGPKPCQIFRSDVSSAR